MIKQQMPAANNGKSFKDTEEYNTVRNMAKDFASKDYSEIDEIRQDLDSLKSNVVALTRHLKNDGADKVEDIKKLARQGVETLREKGDESLQVLDGQIKNNPRSSILIAFAAGVVANFLLRRG